MVLNSVHFLHLFKMYPPLIAVSDPVRRSFDITLLLHVHLCHLAAWRQPSFCYQPMPTIHAITLHLISLCQGDRSKIIPGKKTVSAWINYWRTAVFSYKSKKDLRSFQDLFLSISELYWTPDSPLDKAHKNIKTANTRLGQGPSSRVPVSNSLSSSCFCRRAWNSAVGSYGITYPSESLLLIHTTEWLP